MEEVCDRGILVRAWKRVRRNKGGAGVDGMTIDDAKTTCVSTGRAFGLNCSMEPTSGSRSSGSRSASRTADQKARRPLRRRQTDPASSAAGARGAVGPDVSEHSYGFRPGRSGHQAVAQAQRYVAEGYSVVVDLDLEKFFDWANHDSLTARYAGRVIDKRVLKLIGRFSSPG